MMFLIFVFILALIISTILTPIIRDVALRFNLVDLPEERKIHSVPIPVFGGIAIIVSFFSCLILLVMLGKISPSNQSGLLLGSLFIVGIGAWDKIWGIQSHVKMGLLFIIGIVAVITGNIVWISHFWLVNFIFSVFWIAGITNAFNYLDNMDGLSAGLATISAIFFCFISIMTGQTNLAYLSVILAGACLGFLRYNFNRASIFMGDIGSYFIGFILAIIGLDLFIPDFWRLALKLQLDYLKLVSYVVPILILGVPIFDTFLVTVLRPLANRSITHAGKDHSSHRLNHIGFSQKAAVLILYAVQIILGFLAIIIIKADLYQFFAMLGIVVVMIVFAWNFLTRVEVYS